MSGGLTTPKLQNLVSPLGLALFSYGFFLFAWFFPPGLYLQIMQEPDLMFLNWKSLAFCSLCILAFLVGTVVSRSSLNSVVGFLFGVRLTGRPHKPKTELQPLSPRIQGRFLPLFVPILVSVFLGCVTLAVLGIKTDSIALILAEQGQLIKDTNATPVDLSFWGKLIPLAPVHMAIIWWYAYRIQQAELPRKVRRWALLLLWFAVLVAIANSVAHAERVTLMPILVGLFPVYIFTSTKIRTGNLWPVLKPLAFGVVAILGLFFFLSILRGNSLVDGVGQLFLGYTFSSYNRLAATLDGSLKYTFAGNVQDLCWFCSSNKYFNAVFPYATFFHIPDALTTWAVDFSDTGSAGLVGGYTFASVFSYVFRDIGWWAPVYFGVQGIIVGSAWRSFQKGHVFGLMLYPWCAFSVLFWFGFNIFFNDAFFYIAFSAVFLNLYENRSFRRVEDLDNGEMTHHKAAIPA